MFGDYIPGVAQIADVLNAIELLAFTSIKWGKKKVLLEGGIFGEMNGLNKGRQLWSQAQKPLERRGNHPQRVSTFFPGASVSQALLFTSVLPRV